MRILAVTSRPPIPADRGDARRLLSFMRELAARHQVTCVMPRSGLAARGQLEGLGIEARAARFTPWRVARWWFGAAQVAVMARHRVGRAECAAADVIHVSTVRSLTMVPERFWPKVHLDFVDALSRNALERAGSSRVSTFWRRDARALVATEHRALSRVGAASATSAADAAALGTTVRVLPVGVEVPESEPARGDEPTIVFTGNLGYFANVDAAKWLATEIFPLVRRRVDGVRLVLVGARPAAALKRLTRARDVELHADVASMTPFLGAAWVACAPLRFGTGTQFKVLEAAAHSRPVVTTSAVAARLAGFTPDRDLVAADTADGIAEALVALIEDPRRAAAIGDAARRIVRERYSWPALARELERTLEDVAAAAKTDKADKRPL